MADDDQELKRNGDFEFSFGPFRFKGKGLGALLSIVAAGTIGLGGWAYLHHAQAEAMTKLMSNLDNGQKLLVCVIAEDSAIARKAQLRDPNSDCRRFAKGEL